MQQGIHDYTATGSAAALTTWRWLLADGYGMANRPDEGLYALKDALTMVERTDERFIEPALYYQQGVLLQRQTAPDRARAEACLQQALDIARRQQARWWALRSAMRLAELWRDQGKPAQAYQRLALVYDGFTEGFDTVYLQQTKALLAQLR